MDESAAAPATATEEDVESPETPAGPAELEAAPGHGAGAEHAGHSHPSPLKYVGVALLLAVVTGIEVWLYYIEMPDGLLVAMLFGLAAIKFGMVAAFFMHLKFDGRLLRRLFVTGIVLAISVYAIVLLTLDVLVG